MVGVGGIVERQWYHQGRGNDRMKVEEKDHNQHPQSPYTTWTCRPPASVRLSVRLSPHQHATNQFACLSLCLLSCLSSIRWGGSVGAGGMVTPMVAGEVEGPEVMVVVMVAAGKEHGRHLQCSYARSSIFFLGTRFRQTHRCPHISLLCLFLIPFSPPPPLPSLPHAHARPACHLAGV